MNAFQPSGLPQQPSIQKKQAVPRPKRHLRQRSYKVMAVEVTAKIAVNCAISAAAISALLQLLPNHLSQQAKLKEVSTEVKKMEKIVSSLQTKFSRNFDPRQTKSVMQQQVYKFEPGQRPVVLTDQYGKEIELSEPLN
ncbi:hypothetical protein Nos7524_5097 [Nostoc sp. PCC 7524]|uniref:slr1601 family putative cell division protein n=1 Tax=Nostoc sp. (strain ATCC 29411 / PCC 7524) TaxID=28072 RepID=UPI00029EE649|nr:hypothetical protein [Nostoc sp. PCC 7524]AFY50822.1 hypothetical protein Nos7524_5097 [Nostoc sp. PCC 7524]